MNRKAFDKARRGDIDLRGYEVVRTQFFNSAAIRSVTLSDTGIRFSAECIRKLGCVEYIEILVHPSKKLLAVSPCGRKNKRAVRWAAFTGEKFRSRRISGVAFIGTLFELFGWQSEHTYRFRGNVRSINGEMIIEFDLSEPEIMMQGTILYRNDWYADFGCDYYSYAQTAYILANEVIAMTGHAEYNTEPDIHPTEHDVLDEYIRKFIIQIQNTEANNESGRKT